MDKPHNIGAILFFLPGYGMTMKNIEEATIAAKERSLHLNKIKERKIVKFIKKYTYLLNKLKSQ